VAGFLGISNLLPGTVEGSDETHATVRLLDDTRIRAPRSSVAGHERVSVGVRPEKIRLRETTEPAPNGHNELDGVVRDASYMGVSTQYQVEARGGARLTVYEQNVERATRAELWTPGEAVRMTWSPDHCFVVTDDRAGADPATGDAPKSDAAITPSEPVEIPA
jgi:spermidine/putrescine transport system ATP-binding protein